MSKITYPSCCLGLLFLLHSCGTQNKSSSSGGEIIVRQSTPETPVATPAKKTADAGELLKTKYAAALEINPDKISNIKLYRFIDNWLGTPYKWGGTDRRGIDCSAFVQQLLDTAYNVKLVRTSNEQFFLDAVNRFVSTKQLAEGDLVFFQTIGNNLVSHVGLYLHNGYFVNSSSSKGVSIARLDDPYWKSKYVASGRIKLSYFTGNGK